MRVQVSIHDVSPAFVGEVEDALAVCAKVGVKPALLVVPNFHGGWPLREHPAFCARLRDLQAAGHEVYLHGFFHQARLGDGDAHLPQRARGAGPQGSLRWRFAQRVASAGEAEFSDLSPDEALERLLDGERELTAAGLRIDGFVPPAWSMPRWVHALLRDRGYRFSEDHLRVYDPAAGRARPSVVLNYASRTPARLYSSVAWCRLAKHAAIALPARIALHPADMRVPLLRREIDRLLAWGSGAWVSTGARLLQ
ncbi:MAG TPA: polysaccharide deacetylase family protein [Polyangiaceae bacterium]|jgi:hypothetical protein